MSGNLPRHAQRVDPFLVEAIAQGVILHSKDAKEATTPTCATNNEDRKIHWINRRNRLKWSGVNVDKMDRALTLADIQRINAAHEKRCMRALKKHSW